MDRQCNYHIPGTLLGHLRHRAEGRGWRWRKLPPEAGTDPVGNSDTGAQRDSNTGTDPGAQRDTDTVADTLGDSGVYTFADPVGDAIAQRDGNADSVGNSDTNADAQRDGNPVAVGHTDAEGHAFGVNTRAHDLPDPHAGSGGRVAPIPAAAQAAGWSAGGHWHCQ